MLSLRLQIEPEVAEDGRMICVDAFLEGSVPLDKAGSVLSG